MRFSTLSIVRAVAGVCLAPDAATSAILPEDRIAETFGALPDVVTGNATDDLASLIKGDVKPVNDTEVDRIRTTMNDQRTRYPNTIYADLTKLADSQAQMRIAGDQLGSFQKGRDYIYRSYLQRGYDLAEPIRVMAAAGEPKFHKVNGHKAFTDAGVKLRGHIRVAAAKMLHQRNPELYVVIFPNNLIPAIVEDRLDIEAEFQVVNDHEKRATPLTPLEKFRNAFAFYQMRARTGRVPTQMEMATYIGSNSQKTGRDCQMLTQLDADSRKRILSGEWPIGAIARLFDAGRKDTGTTDVRLPGDEFGNNYNDAVAGLVKANGKISEIESDTLTISDMKAYAASITPILPVLEAILAPLIKGKRKETSETGDVIDYAARGIEHAKALAELFGETADTDKRYAKFIPEPVAGDNETDAIEEAAQGATAALADENTDRRTGSDVGSGSVPKRSGNANNRNRGNQPKRR